MPPLLFFFYALHRSRPLTFSFLLSPFLFSPFLHLLSLLQLYILSYYLCVLVNTTFHSVVICPIFSAASHFFVSALPVLAECRLLIGVRVCLNTQKATRSVENAASNAYIKSRPPSPRYSHWELNVNLAITAPLLVTFVPAP